MTKPRLILAKKELRALVKHAADFDSYSHLATVHFDGDRGVCAAANGHVLMLRAGEPFEGKWTAHAHELRDVLRRMRGGEKVELTPEHARPRDFHTEHVWGTFPLREPDVAFPGYERPLQPGGAHIATCVDPSLMIRALKQLRKVLGTVPISGADQGVVVRAFGELEPTWLSGRVEGVTWMVVVMPYRTDDWYLASGTELAKRFEPKAPEVKASKAKKGARK